MSKVNWDMRDRVALVRLNHGAINPISWELIHDLSRAVQRAGREAGGLVLAGGEKFFSMGLDLPSLLKLDRTDLAAYWEDFCQILLDLYTLPIPTAAAVVGHAPAGGTALALPCDYRFVASGKIKVGVNEVQIGLPFPYLPHLMLRQIVGDRAATEMTYSGRLFDGAEAKAIGLADEVLPPEEVESRAMDKVTQLAGISPEAFAETKITRIEEVHKLYKQNRVRANSAFVNAFFSDRARVLLAEAAKKF